jgi:V8-like Glu-specific endopeptidase
VSEQEQRVSNGHESVSNAPEELRDKVAVPEGYEVSEEPFEGEGTEGTQAGSLQEMAAEAVSKLVQRRTAPDISRLPDIAEATFGPLHPGTAVEERLTPREIIDTDDRIQIQDTRLFPWSAIASLRATLADNSLWHGTGWFIGPHTLVTAGHSVYIYRPGHPSHGWARSIEVMPGRNGTMLPFPTVRSKNFRSVIGWTQFGDEDYDYGAIILPTELGDVGGFGFGVYPDSDLLASTVCVSGYPAPQGFPTDKPPGTQWWHCRRVAKVDSTSVYFDIDVTGGQSGSPVFRILGGGPFGVAILTRELFSLNYGVRIGRDVYDNLVAWKA